MTGAKVRRAPKFLNLECFDLRFVFNWFFIFGKGVMPWPNVKQEIGNNKEVNLVQTQLSKVKCANRRDGKGTVLAYQGASVLFII
uniref:Uncharacterized protein n=1 Tax=Romanomermis culicivorax TaxID=13658 RepID=A0A915IZ32_ROMCU